MKIKKSMFAQMLLAGLALGSLQVFSDPTAAPLDFEKINQSIKTALTEYSATTDGTASLMYALDPQGTDIDQDKYLLRTRLELAKSPSSDGPLVSVGTLGIRADLSDPKQAGFILSVDKKTTTDVLPLLVKHITAASHCESAKLAQGVVEIFWKRHCSYVARLPKVKSIDELRELLVEKIAVHKADVAAYRFSLQAALGVDELQPAPVKKVRSLLVDELKRSQRFLIFLNRVAVQKTETGFTLTLPAFADCPIMATNGMRLVVNPGDISVKGEFHAKLGRSLYAAARPVIVDVLRGLESGDPVAMQMVKFDAIILKNLITEM